MEPETETQHSPDNRQEIQVGRIVSELLDADSGDSRAQEADLLRRHPALARELKGQMAVIRRLRQVARLRTSGSFDLP